jgi:outer membrane protein assembly factor BamB
MNKRSILLSLAFLLVAGFASNTVFALYETTDPWPMYRYDLTRSGTTTSTAPNTNKTLWTHTSTSSVGIPIVVDGKVIFISYYNLYALDETTGIQLWQSISFPTQPRGVPAFADGKLYVGSYGGYLYCLNATTGEKLWEYDASPDQIQSSPAVSMGRVYFGTTNGYLYAIDASTGLYIWRFGPKDSIYSSPAIDGDMLYFGCDDGKVYALNHTGAHPALKWTYPTKGRVRSTPTVDGDKLFFGSYSQDHSIFAVDKTTGNLIWKYTFTSSWTAENPVAVAGGIVYCAPTGGNKAYALYANATAGINYTETDPAIRLWSTTLDWYPTELVVADGKVFLSASKNLYALDTPYGHIVWTYTFTYSAGSSIVADGRLFVPQSNKLYCFGSSYPPVTYHYTVHAGGQTFDIMLVINATAGPLDTAGLVTLKKISYTLEGISGTTGMSNITIPNVMLGGPYTVTVDGGLPIDPPGVIESSNDTHTSLYFTYMHSSHTVEIEGTTAIPEFPSLMILPLLITISLIAVALTKKKLSKN